MSNTAKLFLVGFLMLILGFGIGFLVNAETKVATVPDTAVNRLRQNTSLLPENERVAPELWRLSVDPFWTPSASPVSPTAVPGLDHFPLRTPEVKTSVDDKNVRVVVSFPGPGLTEKDLDVHVGNNKVTIKGQKEDHKEKGADVATIRQAFEEAVSLPCQVDGEKARVTVKDGQLTISIPKTNVAQKTEHTWH